MYSIVLDLHSFVLIGVSDILIYTHSTDGIGVSAVYTPRAYI